MTGLSQDDFNRNQPQGAAGCGHRERKENTKALAGHLTYLTAHSNGTRLNQSSTPTQTQTHSHLDADLELQPLYPSQFTTGVPSLPSAPQPDAATTEPFTFEPGKMDQFIQTNIVGATSQVEPSGSTEAFASSDDELDNLLIQSNFRVTSQPVNILPWKHKSQSQKASSTNDESIHSISYVYVSSF
ncbi:hypothetical protein ARMGADRAFT_1034993 [Armillaria gallica]|uniref:Uncharacterized protein n=1 Tax=Armillaria gallica TaxID=47427 RepID=A0A2H3CZ54_ARMGA|nr:hypothetical protein ARMGADRAFT_1034993 [Armillaria gallica]